MFLHLSVSRSVHGGDVSQHALGQTRPPLWADTHPLSSACWDTAPNPPAATAADGTHPTGMHSC